VLDCLASTRWSDCLGTRCPSQARMAKSKFTCMVGRATVENALLFGPAKTAVSEPRCQCQFGRHSTFSPFPSGVKEDLKHSKVIWPPERSHLSHQCLLCGHEWLQLLLGPPPLYTAGRRCSLSSDSNPSTTFGLRPSPASFGKEVPESKWLIGSLMDERELDGRYQQW
jgi:hypothetical protein